MNVPLPVERTAIAQEADLADGQGKRFQVGRGSSRVEGFLIRHGGRFYAYVNRCRHMPMPLDLVPNHFFTANKKHLRCQSHGAMYEPETGKCFAGPCRGKGLDPLPVAAEGGVVYYLGDGEAPRA